MSARVPFCQHALLDCIQGEVEQIAMMKPKGQTEHDEGMLEYLEDIIGSCRLKEPIQTLARRIELLNEQRGEKVTTFFTLSAQTDQLTGFLSRVLVCCAFIWLFEEGLFVFAYFCVFFSHLAGPSALFIQ